ncbi:hypothetical protein HC891_12825 [Candidatus Gracilibacteria bacterium]|nr:hypothetical protein [Candidatus Gracilibacteria bacterium]
MCIEVRGFVINRDTYPSEEIVMSTPENDMALLSTLSNQMADAVDA